MQGSWLPTSDPKQVGPSTYNDPSGAQSLPGREIVSYVLMEAPVAGTGWQGLWYKRGP